MPPTVRARVMLAALVVLGAAVRFHALDFGLPYPQARPDETFIIDSARKLVSGQLPAFYDYPWLNIWMTAGGYLAHYALGAVQGTFGSVADMVASWPTRWEPFFLIPRAIAATAGTLTIVAVFRLGRQLRDETTGLVSALFLALAFLHVRDSHFGTTDTTTTLFIVLCLSALVDVVASGRRTSYVVAGLTAGLAAASKYSAVLLLAPLVVALALVAWQTPRQQWPSILTRRVAWLVVAGLAAFAIGVPFVLLDQARFVAAMQELAHSMRVGSPHLDLDSGWRHHVERSLRHGLGLPLLVSGALGLPLLAVRRPREGLVVLAFVGVYSAAIVTGRNLFFRYTIPLLPVLCVSAAIMVTELAARLRPVSPWLQRLPVGAIAGAFAVLLVASSVPRVFHLNRVLAATDNRVLVARWVQAAAVPGASLLQTGSHFGHARFMTPGGYAEWKWDKGRRAFMLRHQRAEGSPEWILVQQSPLPSVTQDVVLEMLKDGYVQVARFEAWPPDLDAVYDTQDAFFVPFTRLDRVQRPGPNFTVYRRLATDASSVQRAGR